jgi:MFS superfamily sulfate permease-like transporter
MVFGGILCVIIGGFFSIVSFSSDKDKRNNTLGCLTIALIIGGIIVILFGFSRCSG